MRTGCGASRSGRSSRRSITTTSRSTAFGRSIPGNPDLKTGSTFSTLASVLEISGDRPAFYERQPVPHGEIRTHWYHSKSLEHAATADGVHAAGLRQGIATTRYPVLYLFHGANADETAWHRLGRANLILDNLLAAGKDAAVPRRHAVWLRRAARLSPRAAARTRELFGKDLLEDVIPYVESTYRVARPIATIAPSSGLSMGGGQALSIGLESPRAASATSADSAPASGPPTDFPKTYAAADRASPTRRTAKLRLLWIGCGTDDGAFAASKSFSEFLTATRSRTPSARRQARTRGWSGVAT